MYDKPVMTCFKYQVHLYGLETITHLNLNWSSHCPPPPLPTVQAALPHFFVWQHYLHTFGGEL
jgi:hypothetical protein